jgi:pimeloyl-ACP methyl ester carboxylesterase
MSSSPTFIELDWRQRRDRIETQWLRPERRERPLMVFLHEGLGSLSAWRDFPLRLCEAADCRGLVFSRPGYGQSTPRAPGERWGLDYLHAQAHGLLPALFAALGLDTAAAPPWLFGHSDGGSIALLHAARSPERVAGVIAVASHVFVENVTIDNLRLARQAYQQGDLRGKLARHHADPDSPFYGWNDAWLTPAFRDWNIEAELPGLRCPLLAVQGDRDEYASLAQLAAIQARLPHAQLCVLPDCGHSPQREQPQALIRHSVDFMRAHPPAA